MLPATPISGFDGVLGPLLASGWLQAPPAPGLLARLGPYEILRPLGYGGMGIVLLALETDATTRIALKILRPELAGRPEPVRRFLTEARHLQQLRHPHITPVLALGECPDMPYFTMPFFEPGSLAQRLTPGAPYPLERMAAGLRQLAAALRHAHLQGVLHRDLKPSNVLTDRHDNFFLADFGLARSLVQPAETKAPGRFVGTPAYLSPALAAGEPEGIPADIYAFGALLYELLTGQPPYRGASPEATLVLIRTAAPTPIPALNPQAPPGLVRLAEIAMARDPRQRYASMESLAMELAPVTHTLPVFAFDPSG